MITEFRMYVDKNHNKVEKDKATFEIISRYENDELIDERIVLLNADLITLRIDL